MTGIALWMMGDVLEHSMLDVRQTKLKNQPPPLPTNQQMFQLRLQQHQFQIAGAHTPTIPLEYVSVASSYLLGKDVQRDSTACLLMNSQTLKMPRCMMVAR